jgi:two-component system chemotaxis response regulator CheB/chemosensory pili system protein ChpB (putative protein-glutamate methylesterase)
MIANKLAFAVLTLVILLAIAFYAMYRKTGTVTVGAIDLYLCLHNLKYIILLRLSPLLQFLSILFDTPPEFLDHLSPALPVSILLAHHFNQAMIGTLPRILNRHNDWRCQLITSSQRLRGGQCLIVPIDKQIVCDSTGRIILIDQAWEGDYKPAIGQILKNTSDVYGSELINIIFSGMGNDGSQYLDLIQDNDSQLWAQDPISSACPSQPQAIIDSGYCQFVGSPKALAEKLTHYIAERAMPASSESFIVSDI